MSADLQNPIFNDEDKAREALESLVWPNVGFALIAETSIKTRLLKLRANRFAPASIIARPAMANSLQR